MILTARRMRTVNVRSSYQHLDVYDSVLFTYLPVIIGVPFQRPLRSHVRRALGVDRQYSTEAEE
jgi:hypothetical protein